MGSTSALVLAAATAVLPFHISFTDGRCRRCETQMLGSIQFSESRVLWAQGYTPPGGEAGAGEWTLVTSHDGGRSWRELRDSWSHNEGTRAFFFAHGRDGWIMAPNSLRLGAEPYYASTTDGRRWRTLRAE